MRFAIGVVALLSCLCQSAFGSADTYSIKRVPKVGEVVKYAMTVDFEVNGGQGHLLATISEKVLDVDKDGNYTVEQTQTEAKGTYNSEKIDVPQRGAITTTYKPNGQATLIKGEQIDALSYRMENLATILDPGKPLATGDIWTAAIKADKALGTVEARGEYRLLAADKLGTFDVLKIKATMKEFEGEKPAMNEFTQWINREDNSMVQLEAKWYNAPFPGVSYPVTATIKMTRIVPQSR